MRQHYLPKFYLRGFVEEAGPRSLRRLWVYSKTERKWAKRSPRSVAAIPNLYSFVGGEGWRWDRVENAFGLSETQTARVVREKLIRRRPLDESDRVTLVTFLSGMLVRVPVVTKELVELVSGVDEDVLIDRWRKQTNKPIRHIFERVIRRPLPDQITKEDVRLIKAIINAHLADPMSDEAKYARLHLIATGVPVHFTALGRMSWTFLLAARPNYFITSDRPVVWLNPKAGTLSGLVEQDTELSFAFSSQVALLATWQAHADLYADASFEIASLLNGRIFYMAREFVVSPKPGFPGDDALLDDKYYAR
ncbi:MAG: DUF4238 domain-containing protein [Acidobacteriota bacterium]